MCDDVTCEHINLARMVVMDHKTCDDLTYDELNLDVLENVVLGLMV